MRPKRALVQAIVVVLHDLACWGSRVRLPPALSGVSRRAHAERRSTSRLVLCDKVDQKCGRSTSEEVAANFVAGSPESTEIPHVFGTWPIASGLIGSLRTFAGEIITFSLRLRAVQVTAPPRFTGWAMPFGPRESLQCEFLDRALHDTRLFIA